MSKNRRPDGSRNRVDEVETQLAASRAAAKSLLEALVAELTAGDSRSSPFETVDPPQVPSAVLDKRQVFC
jgi:hypothetical protein